MHAKWGVGGVILLYGPLHLVQGKVFGRSTLPYRTHNSSYYMHAAAYTLQTRRCMQSLACPGLIAKCDIRGNTAQSAWCVCLLCVFCALEYAFKHKYSRFIH
jgi:hypothetical protein